MHRHWNRVRVVAIVLGVALAAPVHAATVLTHEFRYGAGQFSLIERAGLTEVSVAGGLPERRAGRPDLPVVEERIEFPADMRIARVEVVTLEVELIGEHLHIAPALDPRQDPSLDRRTAQDPAFYSGGGLQPETPVALGTHGFERDHHIAWLEVTPVRWSATSGRLERISRLVVRLVLEPSSARPLGRERVVPEWEDQRPVLAGSPASASSPTGGAVRSSAGRAGGTSRRAEPYQATQLPSLEGSPVAYVIITSDSMAPAFQVLADWKTASGLPAEVRTLSFIRAQYPSAADDLERIRQFIRDAYTRWGTRWVLLGGDTDLIPARSARMTIFDDENIPTDLYYSCLDGNWNADGDSIYAEGYFSAETPGDAADLMPEVWVGRAPVMTATDAGRFVQKTLAYVKSPVADAMNNLLFFAEVISPQPWIPGHTPQLDGAQLVEQDLLPILDFTPWMHSARLYQNYTDVRWRPGSLPETRVAVLDSLNRGYNIAVHVGHGYREVMSVGNDNLTNNDMNALVNGGRLMNFYAIDCTSNAIDFSSIGEAVMRAPMGGAVTNIGSTALVFPAVGRIYQKEYFRVLFRDSVTAVGEAQARQKFPYIGRSYYDGFDRLSQMALLLLGDPELHIYTGTPRELTVTAPDSVLANDGAVTVHVEVAGGPLLGARVTAWMPGHDYGSALTDGAGNVALSFHPDTLGPFTLTVTAFDARPVQSTHHVVAGAQATLEAEPLTITDDALDGRHGDEDGVADAGELVDVRIPVRNVGSNGDGAVIGTLSTPDTMVSIAVPTADYGAIDPGTTAVSVAGYRLSLRFACPDQHEVPLTLDLIGDDLQHHVQHVTLLIHAPELVQVSHLESETGGNNDGRPQPGETVSYALHFYNRGSAGAHGLSGVLRNLDGLATVLDSTFTMPDLAAGAEGTSTPVRFVPASAAARLVLEVSDADGLRGAQSLDLGYPGTVADVSAVTGSGLTRLAWTALTDSDLAGYSLYRSTSAGGPFVRVSPAAGGRTAGAVDVGLAALTHYYYWITATDSSGNESGPSAIVSAVTNPAMHAGFPAYTRETSETPVAIARVTPGSASELVVGGDLLHLLRADGSAPVDADGSNATLADVSTQGRYYAGGASISDLDGDGNRELIAAAWTSQQLLVFNELGQTRAGFPVHIDFPMWSGVAVGDLDGDGSKEMVFASLGQPLYAFRSNGNEWLDGDANPSTIGVFKLLGSAFNPGTPALADLLGNGKQDIVYGSYDGLLYAWQPNGSNVPGFPVNLGAPVSGSVAVGRLDGPGGPLSIVAPAGDNTLRVRLADGTNHPGFPVVAPSDGTNHASSPALADMNGDGFADIVFAATNGRIYVFDRNGAQLPLWSASRFSTLAVGATESSPVVADIDGDGHPDVVVGDENGSLAALSGATGSMLPGFPIQLDAEASGTPALCDCDGDGKSEIVDVDFGGTVRMWDYDFPFSPGVAPPWPQFHHDAERTGNSETHSTVAVEPVAALAPRVLELALPQPNPARVSVQLAYGVPLERNGAALDVAIYDLAGRRVRTLLQGMARPGRSSVGWDLRDSRGVPAARGVYLLRLAVGPEALTRKMIVLR